MTFINGIGTFPRYIRLFILFFTLSLSFGYFSGFRFLQNSTDLKPSGIEENYNGNEDDENAEVMRFKKSKIEMLTIIHTHVLSFSLIFFCLGLILLTIPIDLRIKKLLITEPFISTIATFGGIWLMWKGYTSFKYLVLISGMLITTTFIISVALIMWHTLLKKYR